MLYNVKGNWVLLKADILSLFRKLWELQVKMSCLAKCSLMCIDPFE